MAQDYQDITVDHEGAVAVLTLNRPAVVNALSARLLDEFHSAVRRLDEADSGVSVIVVTGAGDRAFSAWTDIHEMARLAEEGKPPPSASHVESNWSLAMARKPTIGALNGLCYGGGALLASLLDMRVGSHRTRFRFLAVTYGRINSTWLLPTLIGMPLAKELIQTGRVMDGEEAHRVGLLHRLVEPEHVLPAAIELADEIAGNDQRMVQGAKRLMSEGIGMSWRAQLDRELAAQKGPLAGAPAD